MDLCRARVLLFGGIDHLERTVVHVCHQERARTRFSSSSLPDGGRHEGGQSCSWRACAHNTLLGRTSIGNPTGRHTLQHWCGACGFTRYRFTPHSSNPALTPSCHRTFIRTLVTSIDPFIPHPASSAVQKYSQLCCVTHHRLANSMHCPAPCKCVHTLCNGPSPVIVSPFHPSPRGCYYLFPPEARLVPSYSLPAWLRFFPNQSLHKPFPVIPSRAHPSLWGH